MKIGNITATDARLKKALTNNINSLVTNEITKTITTTVDNSKIRTGVVTKFYPYINKVEVKLDNGSITICKILHFFSGALLCLFTPDGEEAFCDNLNQPCIIPLGNLTCLLADINETDSEEYVLLGYYIPEELSTGVTPPNPGNFTINSIGATTTKTIGFGNEGLKLSLDDYYTKEDVDKLIDDLKEELINGDEE